MDYFSLLSSQTSMLSLPKRKAFFVFYGDKVTKTIDGLNVRFDIHSEVKNSGNHGNFGICNLNAEDRKFLASRFEISKRKFDFFAGYGDDVVKVFTGYTNMTTLSTPPEIWLDFQAWYNSDKNGIFIEKSIAGNNPIRNVIELAAKWYDPTMIVVWMATSQKIISNFSYSGTASNLLVRLGELDENIGLWENKGQLFVFDKEDGIQGRKEWLITPENGMIGTPQFNPSGAVVTTFFNPHIEVADIVIGESALQPYYNFRGVVSQVDHIGELRGNQFITKLNINFPTNNHFLG